MTEFIWRGGVPGQDECARPGECGAGSVCVRCARLAVIEEAREIYSQHCEMDDDEFDEWLHKRAHWEEE